MERKHEYIFPNNVILFGTNVFTYIKLSDTQNGESIIPIVIIVKINENVVLLFIFVSFFVHCKIDKTI